MGLDSAGSDHREKLLSRCHWFTC